MKRLLGDDPTESLAILMLTGTVALIGVGGISVLVILAFRVGC